MFLKNEDGINISICQHCAGILFMWKAQSKLKPYGTCINGPVDGFSHNYEILISTAPNLIIMRSGSCNYEIRCLFFVFCFIY